MAIDLTERVRDSSGISFAAGGEASERKTVHILNGFVDVDRTSLENDFIFRVGPRFTNGQVESSTVSLSIASVGILPRPGVQPDPNMRWQPGSIFRQDVDVDLQTGQLEVRFQAGQVSAGDFEIAVLSVAFQLTVLAGSQ